jgi:hypothetical protein
MSYVVLRDQYSHSFTSYVTGQTLARISLQNDSHLGVNIHQCHTEFTKFAQFETITIQVSLGKNAKHKHNSKTALTSPYHQVTHQQVTVIHLFLICLGSSGD